MPSATSWGGQWGELHTGLGLADSIPARCHLIAKLLVKTPDGNLYL
jgi:hypothetical protein